MNNHLHRQILGLALAFCVTPLVAQTYFHDAVGRLIQVSYPSGNGIRYTYDDADNLISVQPINLPVAPTNLQLERVSGTKVMLTWSDNSGSEGGFVIQRRNVGNNDWFEVGFIGSNASQFIDDTAEPGAEYAYRVAAEGAQGSSAFSNVGDTAANALRISAFSLQTGALGRRMRLQFPTVAARTYRVELKPGLEALAWQSAPFSPSLDGVTGSQSINGTGGEVSLYIEAPAGQAFYRIVRQ